MNLIVIYKIYRQADQKKRITQHIEPVIFLFFQAYFFRTKKESIMTDGF